MQRMELYRRLEYLCHTVPNATIHLAHEDVPSPYGVVVARVTCTGVQDHDKVSRSIRDGGIFSCLCFYLPSL